MLEQVRHEVKGQLAKLLATEDLVVENKQVSTAQFNVHTRVLTLPLWDRASNSVYDMLVAHEVGHALFTPDIDWLKDHKVHPSIVNIVEDVRIEKLMKRKYAGLPKTFYHGYEELNDDDFFSVVDEDIDEITQKALTEFHTLKNKIEEKGIKVTSLKGSKECPDHIFPNWFMTFDNKTMQIFSMLAPNRREEKKLSMIEHLSNTYKLSADFSYLENKEIFLESTSSMFLIE